MGQLTIGALPDGVSNNSLTWVPVRLYTSAQGGLPGPTSNPNEVYVQLICICYITGLYAHVYVGLSNVCEMFSNFILYKNLSRSIQTLGGSTGRCYVEWPDATETTALGWCRLHCTGRFCEFQFCGFNLSLTFHNRELLSFLVHKMLSLPCIPPSQLVALLLPEPYPRFLALPLYTYHL